MRYILLYHSINCQKSQPTAAVDRGNFILNILRQKTTLDKRGALCYTIQALKVPSKYRGVEQLFGLVVARQALIDAGYYGPNARPFNRENTGVIMSAGTASPNSCSTAVCSMTLGEMPNSLVSNSIGPD